MYIIIIGEGNIHVYNNKISYPTDIIILYHRIRNVQSVQSYSICVNEIDTNKIMLLFSKIIEYFFFKIEGYTYVYYYLINRPNYIYLIWMNMWLRVILEVGILKIIRGM